LRGLATTCCMQRLPTMLAHLPRSLIRQATSMILKENSYLGCVGVPD
jgi:hypothetical protein